MHHHGAPSACSWSRLENWLGAASTQWYWQYGILCWGVQVDDDNIATVSMLCTKALVAGGEWTGGMRGGQKCVCGMKKSLQETSMSKNVCSVYAGCPTSTPTKCS